MTKINVISGFLGAGKTTLIKKLLSEVFAGQKIVLIENEFGEIGIDGGFLKEAGVEITEMNSGCICCSLVGDFGKALKEVLEKFAPDRIIIEPSGVGKLSDVTKAIEGVAKDTEVELDGSITVADATKCKIYMKNFGEFFNNQVECADTIVLSRTQNMKEEKLEAAVKLLQEHNSRAAIITTPWDELDGSIILKAMDEKNSMAEELLREAHEHEHHHDGECCHDHEHEHEHHHDGECCCGHDHEHHHHHADEVFTSWGKETPHKYAEEDLKQILEVLANETGYGVILRAKGIVAGTDGSWIQFDLVPGEYEIRKGSPDYTGRLCVIGSQLKEEELAKLFQLA
ncbi:MAG: GTP-binding protein [Lachnospiraceae bacterium]|nr:GTP-binding protein [Lachnospiraceae bacterium]